MMESSTAAHAESGVESRPVASPASNGPTSRARQRGAILTKLLALSDVIAATVAAVVVPAVTGHTEVEGLLFVVAAVVLWPVAAFSVGL